MGSPRSLTVLRDEVDARVSAMQNSHGDWPCAAGCDACCRRLGALPQVTAPEFASLWGAIEALPDRDAVREAIITARPDAAGHYTCPMLDRDAGRCRVYEARPIACRTYGFYAGRDGDYWCDRVTQHLHARRDTLVAGSQMGTDRRRDATLGPSLDLAELVARTDSA